MHGKELAAETGFVCVRAVINDAAIVQHTYQIETQMSYAIEWLCRHKLQAARRN